MVVWLLIMVVVVVEVGMVANYAVVFVVVDGCGDGGGS